MDDQQGNLIDGTARARQWRRSRPKSRAPGDSAEQHSDAPKSIAASLLVPAEMLDAAVAPVTGRDPVGTNPDLQEPGRDPDETRDHVNPFLVPDGYDASTHQKKAGYPRRTSLARWLSSGRPPSRALRVTAPITLALAALVVLAVGISGLGQSGSRRGRITQTQAAAATGGSLGRLTAGLLASNPFSAQGSLHRPLAPRPDDVSAHHSGTDRSTTPRASTRPVTARVIAVRHIPAGSGHTSSTPSDVSRSISPRTPSSSTAASTATPTPSAVSQHATISSSGSGSSGQRPAFGANGLLAPGSSPDS